MSATSDKSETRNAPENRGLAEPVCAADRTRRPANAPLPSFASVTSSVSRAASPLNAAVIAKPASGRTRANSRPASPDNARTFCAANRSSPSMPAGAPSTSFILPRNAYWSAPSRTAASVIKACDGTPSMVMVRRAGFRVASDASRRPANRPRNPTSWKSSAAVRPSIDRFARNG